MLACDVTTSPSSASASNARTSASCRARRRSAAMAGLEKADQTLESQPIALGAEPGHYPHRGVREPGPRRSALADAAVGIVAGFGAESYRLGLEGLVGR